MDQWATDLKNKTSACEFGITERLVDQGQSGIWNKKWPRQGTSFEGG